MSGLRHAAKQHQMNVVRLPDVEHWPLLLRSYGAWLQLVVWARDWCIARKKHGLLAAHQNMLREVMLLGLISFLLVAFEDKLQEICGMAAPP